MNFELIPADILNFPKCTFRAQLYMGGDEWQIKLKFGENWSSVSEDIRILVIIVKIPNGAAGPSWILKFECLVLCAC